MWHVACCNLWILIWFDFVFGVDWQSFACWEPDLASNSSSQTETQTTSYLIAFGIVCSYILWQVAGCLLPVTCPYPFPPHPTLIGNKEPRIWKCKMHWPTFCTKIDFEFGTAIGVEVGLNGEYKNLPQIVELPHQMVFRMASSSKLESVYCCCCSRCRWTGAVPGRSQGLGRNRRCCCENHEAFVGAAAVGGETSRRMARNDFVMESNSWRYLKCKRGQMLIVNT